MDMNDAITPIPDMPQIEIRKPKGSLTKTKSYIRDVIGESDPKLLEVWDEIEGDIDTNEVIKFNLQQAQVHLQQEQVRYYTLDAKVQATMERLPTRST